MATHAEGTAVDVNASSSDDEASLPLAEKTSSAAHPTKKDKGKGKQHAVDIEEMTAFTDREVMQNKEAAVQHARQHRQVISIIILSAFLLFDPLRACFNAGGLLEAVIVEDNTRNTSSSSKKPSRRPPTDIGDDSIGLEHLPACLRTPWNAIQRTIQHKLGESDAPTDLHGPGCSDFERFIGLIERYVRTVAPDLRYSVEHRGKDDKVWSKVRTFHLSPPLQGTELICI